ncbi:MAG: endonuclease/exonuclease/phosphatase family protein [Pirellulales bacterium]|nr:endonuclease/exonuclease/phosphatase family protein [Pirellulales bacterium]
MRVLLAAGMVLVVASSAWADEPSTADNSLRVLSNNAGIFPQQVLALYPEKLKEKKQEILADETERAARLAQALIELEDDPDVVLLQEIWSVKARDRLIQDLAAKYPHVKHAPDLGAGVAVMQASGLMVFSQLPLEDFAYQEFTRGIGADKLARKGIVGVRLTKHGRSVAVFTTHLQAGGKRDPSVQPDQLRECREFIRKFVGDRRDEMAVLAGDFNIRSTDAAAYEVIFKQLDGARDTYQQRPGALTTTTRNDQQPNKRIDYLLTFGDVRAESTILDLAGPQITDHLAVLGTIRLD